MPDAKITALTALASPAGTDVLPIVSDPGGTPVTKKITVTALLAGVVAATPTLAEVLAEGNDVNELTIVSADDGTDALGASILLTPAADTVGGEAALRGGANNVDEPGNGGSATIQGGASWNWNAALVTAEGGDETNARHGRLTLTSANSGGAAGQLLQSDGTYATWQTLYSQAAGAPGGTLTTLLYGDTTAVTGGLYVWTGSAYRKLTGVLP